MYDLIIVGGGPAGSSAGREAGKRGLKVLLLEKEEFPRHKPCGGALSEPALSYLDFELPASIREREIFGVRLCHGNSVIERCKEKRIATMVSRGAFDHYLLEKGRETGIDIAIGERVLQIQEKNDCIEVHTDGGCYHARYGIIAEGSQGRLKESVRRRDRKHEYGICVATEIEASEEAIEIRMNRVMEVHFGVLPMGYGWIFPHDTYYSVGIGAFADRASDLKTVMKDFLKRNDFTGPCRLQGHIVPAGGIKRTFVGSRVLLAGDAAGFVDPFAGEGIAYAIRSGRIAASVVDHCIRTDHRGDGLEVYERLCHDAFIRNFTYALMAARIMNRFPRFFFGILTNNADVVDKFAEIPVLKRRYLTFMQWLVPRLPLYLPSLLRR
ncbi:MAG: geranylgeranyl reductase family protein [Deltaproteobacteria bacterium]|nr:geranylgeranyl reductase family protein [Deltaproteobacteria bacterium]